MEWVPAAGERTLRNCLETCSIAEAYDQAFPLPKQYRSNMDTSKAEKGDQQEQSSTHHEHTDAVRPRPTTAAGTDSPDITTVQSSNSETGETATGPSQQAEIVPHRDLYFYLHRPRTTTKKPVVVPLPPSATLTAVLRGRTVLEFPTVYLLSESPEQLSTDKESSTLILEEEYLRTAAEEETAESRHEGTENEPDTGLSGSSVNLEGVDEKKVMEVLKQDLFESVPDTEQTSG